MPTPFDEAPSLFDELPSRKKKEKEEEKAPSLFDFTPVKRQTAPAAPPPPVLSEAPSLFEATPPQRKITPRDIPGFGGATRSDSILENAGADFVEEYEGLKTFGKMLFDNPIETGKMIAKNFIPSLVQSYGRWIEAGKQGVLGDAINQYPIQFAQDLLPLATLGAGIGKQMVKAGTKTRTVLNTVEKAANAADVIVDPMVGVPLVGVNLGAQAVTKRILKQIGNTKAKTVVDAIEDVHNRGSNPAELQEIQKAIVDNTNPNQVARNTIQDEVAMSSQSAQAAGAGAQRIDTDAQAAQFLKDVESGEVGRTSLDPNVVRRGKPITTAGSINLSRMDAPDEFKKVIKHTSDVNQSFIQDRRKPLSIPEMDGLARDMGFSVEDIAQRKGGLGFKAEEGRAAIMVFNKLNKDLQVSTKKALTTKAPEDLLAFEKNFNDFVNVQRSIQTLETEAARFMRSLRDLPKFGEKIDIPESIAPKARGVKSGEPRPPRDFDPDAPPRPPRDFDPESAVGIPGEKKVRRKKKKGRRDMTSFEWAFETNDIGDTIKRLLAMNGKKNRPTPNIEDPTNPLSVSEAVTEAGGYDELLKRAETLNNAMESGNVGAVVKDLGKTNFLDKYNEHWYGSALSNPRTHMQNIASNAAFLLYENVAVPAVSAGVVRPVRFLGGNRSKDLATFAEVGARMEGIYKGFKAAADYGLHKLFAEHSPNKLVPFTNIGSEALSKAQRKSDIALKRRFGVGRPEEFKQKFPNKFDKIIDDTSTKLELRRDAIGTDPDSWKITQVYGKAHRTFSKALEGADIFFKILSYSAELEGQAYRKAVKEGLSLGDLKRKVVEYRTRPTNEMKAFALSASRRNTFQDLISKGRTPDDIKRGVKMHEIGDDIWMGTARLLSNKVHPVIQKIINPFVRTPFNLLRRQSESIPLLNFTTSEGYKLFSKNVFEQDKAISRLLLGSTAIGLGYYLSQDGTITGTAPSDRNEKYTKIESGTFQPNSIRVKGADGKDTFVSMQPFEVLWAPFAIGADIGRISSKLSKGDKKGSALMSEALDHAFAAMMNFTLDKTYMKNFSDLSKQIFRDDPDFMSVAAQVGVNLTPGVPVIGSFLGLQQQVSRVEDPLLKQYNNSMELVRARLPIADQIAEYSGMGDLALRRNFLGDSIQLTGGEAIDYVNPFYVKSKKPEPILKAMIDLDFYPGMPSISSVLRGTKISSEAYGEYLKIRGENIRSQLTSYIEHPNFKRKLSEKKDANGISMNMVNDEAKRQFIASKIRESSEAARNALLIRAQENMDDPKYREIIEYFRSEDYLTKQKLRQLQQSN